jgi:hypothetical protein
MAAVRRGTLTRIGPSISVSNHGTTIPAVSPLVEGHGQVPHLEEPERFNRELAALICGA